MKTLTLLILLFGAVGCGKVSPELQAQLDEEQRQWEHEQAVKRGEFLDGLHDNPTCSEEKECEWLWQAAQAFVARETSMKVQTVSDVLFETYNPSNRSRGLAGRVIREPQPGGGYHLSAIFFCDYSCDLMANTMKVKFNKAMKAFMKPKAEEKTAAN